MLRSRDNRGAPFWAGKASTLLVLAVFGWTSTVYPAVAQSSGAATSVPTQDAAPNAAAEEADVPHYSMSDIEYLLGPIALFPDPLLALVLPAATFPQHVDEADLWVQKHPEAVKGGDFSDVDKKAWDPSVKALTRFPDVLEMLAGHLDWTESLGVAFANQPDDVAATIQMLRAKAEALGNLPSTPEQVVTSRQEGDRRVIYVTPASPERIYVPVYDSTRVFTSAVPGALAFGTGVVVGAAWNNRWGWNNRRWNQVWIDRPVWHAPPPNWRPRPGRPGVRPPEPWRPDRPARPDRPSRPDRPVLRPERPNRPGDRPNRPGERPNRPGERPNRPGERPNRPGERPNRPGERPNRPGERPNRPGASRPDRPAARPQPPGVRPGQPGSRPQRPETRPQRPARQPDRPAARPDRSRDAQRPQPPRQRPGAQPPRNARPQQRNARPAQRQASPQQQRHRPGQHRAPNRRIVPRQQ